MIKQSFNCAQRAHAVQCITVAHVDDIWQQFGLNLVKHDASSSLYMLYSSCKKKPRRFEEQNNTVATVEIRKRERNVIMLQKTTSKLQVNYSAYYTCTI